MTSTRRQALKIGGGLGAAAALGACANEKTEGGSAAPAATASTKADQLGGMDAVATARAIKSGELTAVEAVDAAIARAEAADPELNAIVTATFEAARAKAKAGASGPLGGVPTFYKDLLNAKGVKTGFGSRAFSAYVPDAQPPFTDDLDGAGLISLGKSATPEFGLTATTEPLSDGPTRNPWGLEHSTGGSSGGAAALVAAGVVPIAHASDGGGSVRIPASCCGLVGLKVSNDRFRPARDESRMPVRISVQGCESRTVRDTAAFLASLESDKLPAVGLVGGPSKKRLKIGFFTEVGQGYSTDPQVIAATQSVASRLEELGHVVEEMALPFEVAMADHFLLYWASMANAAVSAWEAQAGRPAGEEDFEPFTLGLRDHFVANQAQIQKSVFELIAFSKAYDESFGDYDLILSPVLAAPPPKIGYLDTRVGFEEASAKVSQYAQFTWPANVAGAASISLPLSWSEEGLPIGALFNARKGEEAMVLHLAYELEQAYPWADKKPALFVG